MLVACFQYGSRINNFFDPCYFTCLLPWQTVETSRLLCPLHLHYHVERHHSRWEGITPISAF